ncbi:MAG: tRNA pseudouridine(38-40) synthase TruA, partial [Candidatus Poseidoniia archaeon]|nr:tRNA pseudouridine(38-40) synthase TruA [Candidatus Poseidoniia archaeon]
MGKFANLFRIAYHGSEFHGSQIQPDVVTVEGIIKGIINKLGATNPIFASRTDKGVNALCNVITTTSDLKCKEFVGDFIEKLESYPIWITGFSDIDLTFNPRIAKQRQYRY